MKKIILATCCLVLVNFSSSYADHHEIKGRRQTGLPADGYTDTFHVPGQTWRVHDKSRPEPAIVDPPSEPGAPPSDATVLFDGKDLNQWQGGQGEALWKVKDGYVEVNGTGSVKTKEGFGSCQLHVEWAAPAEVKDKAQGRGNSGVMLMGLYEIQVLDSYDNRTYSDGQAGSVYGQTPPLVNACRKPGEWQSYDIIFEAPKYEGREVVSPAYVSVIHNGVVVQHRTKIEGRVAHKDPPKYLPHEDKLPLVLQDHGNPVRFRNIWIRPL